MTNPISRLYTRLLWGAKDAAAYRAKLERMSDKQLVAEVSDKVWLAASEEDAGYGKARVEISRAQCDATQREAERRNKPQLFQQGWNAALEGAGYDVSELPPRAT